MNASAIYSKSGKGVQEAAGKTNHLTRPDRAVLSAIDGRATLADVAQKVGKTYDAAFEKLVKDLDKAGFIREVSAGTPGAKPAAAKPATASAKPAADPGSDLDFTAALSIPRGKGTPPPQSPPKAAPPPPTPSVNIPPPPPPPSAAEKAKAERAAKEQQEAFIKAREEAEKKAHAERDRVKSEAEAKVRAETEAKMRAEAKAEADKKFAAELEAKVKAEADRKAAEAEAKVKAVRDAALKAAAEAKAKADAEAKKAREAREEAERARREAEEKAERVRKEAEEKARREQEELKRKLEEERRAREEVERKAKEEARRLEEERRQLEEERRAHEEEKRREEEERAARKKREADEEAQAQAEAVVKPKPKAPEKAPEPAKAGGLGGFSDSLLADLDSFSTREDEELKAKEEAARKEREEAAARAREAEERRQKEEAARKAREEKEQRKREEAERKEREEAELREREEKEKQRLKEEEEKRKKEAEEREKKAKQEERLEAKATATTTFDAAERKRREALLAAGRRPKAASAARVEKKGWGKPITIALFLLLVIVVGVAHVMPIDVADYQTAATDALRRPVTIRSANLSLLTGGLEVKLHDVMIGETRIGEVHAFPELNSLLGPRKHLQRIEIDNGKFEQGVVGEALFTKVRAETFSVGRIVVKHLELTGPLTLPKGLELEVNYDAEGAVRSALVRGPQAMLITVLPKGTTAEFDASASTFTLPFAPEISFTTFAAKGSVTPQALSVQDWSGQVFNGTLSGTANVTWGDSWNIEGALTARNLNAAVFAPALLSDGKGEGSGKFSMRGEPGKLASRIDGSFTISRGVLGSIDLAKAIQSQGKTSQGRTLFNEMNGQMVYDRGAVALRGVTIAAGQLNAGASVDISQSGALSGRVVADVKIASQLQRATLNLGGNLQEPQVRN